MIPVRVAALVAVLFLLVSCGGGSETMPADVNVVVEMKDYSITLSVPNVKAGTVKFGIRNSGGMEHSFELIKTDVAFDQLPTTGDAKAKEDGLVKQVKSLPVGKVEVVTADLAARNYVIICNVAGHYQLGMRAALTVQ